MTSPFRFALVSTCSIYFCFIARSVYAQESSAPENKKGESGALKGESFTACVLLESPYVVADPSKRSGFGGIAIDYLDRLKDDVQFDIEMTRWTESWTSFIERMSTCSPDPTDPDPCPCDLGVGSFTKTADREDSIQFVAPFANEAHAMVSRKSDLQTDDSQTAWFVFKTFTPSVWGIIILGIFLHAIGTIFFGPFYKHPRSSTHTKNRTRQCCSLPLSCSSLFLVIKRFPAAILYAYSHLIGFPSDDQTRGKPSFHRTAWLVLGATAGIFLLTIYEASLTVLLFESSKESSFRTLDDITDCAIDPSRVAIINGGASLRFWQGTVNTTENREKCGWTTAGFTVSNMEEGFKFLKEHRADFFFSLQGSVEFRANRNCGDFEQVGEPFFSTSVAFVTAQKGNSTFREILSRHTRYLREHDAFESASLLAARSSCEDVTDATITSGRLASFFALYAIIWVFLLVYRIIFICSGRNDKEDEDHAASDEEGDVGMFVRSIPAANVSGMVGHPGESYGTDNENSFV